jgi:hypothetical protein
LSMIHLCANAHQCKTLFREHLLQW